MTWRKKKWSHCDIFRTAIRGAQCLGDFDGFQGARKVYIFQNFFRASKGCDTALQKHVTRPPKSSAHKIWKLAHFWTPKSGLGCNSCLWRFVFWGTFFSSGLSPFFKVGGKKGQIWATPPAKIGPADKNLAFFSFFHFFEASISNGRKVVENASFEAQKAGIDRSRWAPSHGAPLALAASCQSPPQAKNFIF